MTQIEIHLLWLRERIWSPTDDDRKRTCSRAAYQNTCDVICSWRFAHHIHSNVLGLHDDEAAGEFCRRNEMRTGMPTSDIIQFAWIRNKYFDAKAVVMFRWDGSLHTNDEFSRNECWPTKLSQYGNRNIFEFDLTAHVQESICDIPFVCHLLFAICPLQAQNGQTSRSWCQCDWMVRLHKRSHIYESQSHPLWQIVSKMVGKTVATRNDANVRAYEYRWTMGNTIKSYACVVNGAKWLHFVFHAIESETKRNLPSNHPPRLVMVKPARKTTASSKN